MMPDPTDRQRAEANKFDTMAAAEKIVDGFNMAAWQEAEDDDDPDFTVLTPREQAIIDISRAIRDARSEGWEAGREEAAKVCRQHAADHRKRRDQYMAKGRIRHANTASADADRCEVLAAAIRALPTPKEK